MNSFDLSLELNVRTPIYQADTTTKIVAAVLEHAGYIDQYASTGSPTSIVTEIA